MKIPRSTHEAKYLIIYAGEKFYLNAHSFETDKEFKVHTFKYESGRTLAVFPIKFCAVILNNPSK